MSPQHNWNSLLKSNRRDNPKDKGRLDLHDVWKTDFTHAGYCSFPEETQYAQPKQNQAEDLFILGSNTGEKTTIEVYFKRRPTVLNASDPFDSPKEQIDVTMTLRDDEGNVYSMSENSVVQFNQSEYRGCGFAYEPLQGNRIGRIKFRGYLKRNDEKLVYVQIRFLVLYFSKIFDHQRAFDDSCLLKQLKDVKESTESFADVLEDKLEQFCQIKGTFKMENEDERELFFLGTVGRRFHPIKAGLSPRKVIKLCGFDVDGLGFQVGIVFQGFIQYVYALASKRGDRFGVLEKLGTLEMKEIMEKVTHGMKTEFEITLSEKMKLKIEVEASSEEGAKWRAVKVNGIDGMAFIEERDFDESEVIREIAGNSGMTPDFLVVSLEENCASLPELTGGKGASLAQLKKLSQGKEWTVPGAIIVTCTAFRLQTEAMNGFEEKLNELERLIIEETEVEKNCQLFIDWFTGSELNEKIVLELKTKMEAEFGSDWESVLLAVRSSAAGEDGSEMSAAGQMNTYLGISGLDALSRAVVACWASQFAFVPVTYKRGYGQAILAPMAVVVQRMVDCQAAGVIFTARPLDGDERILTVSANFGLGESVVSAAAEPDTFLLGVDIQANSYAIERKISGISEKILGKKAIATRLNHEQSQVDSLEGGTINQQIVDGAQLQSLTDEELLQVGAIALEIAAHYGNPRDIEFGLTSGTFHLFQSRPITNLDSSFTPYELMHELDSAHMCESEINSRSHIGEILPGSVSWIGLYYMLTEYFMARTSLADGMFSDFDYNPYRSAVGVMANQIMLGLKSPLSASLFSAYPESDFAVAAVFAFFGRHITDPDVLEVFRQAKATAKSPPLKAKIKMAGMAWGALFTVGKRIPALKRAVFEENAGDMLEAMEAIPLEGKNNFVFLQLLDSLNRAAIHNETLAGSFIKSMILRKILKRGNSPEEVANAEADHNLLLSNCTDVVSAEVPKRLREIANSLEDKDAFSGMDDEDALKVLKGEMGKEGVAVKMFADFLAKHGHRGHREPDPYFLTMKNNPLPCVQIIKSLLQNKASLEPRPPVPVEELFAQLKTPLSWTKKWLIKRWILPWCRNAVGYRENTKSIMVKFQDRYRDALWEIARCMHRKGLLPEVELFFFLKLDEIEAIIGGARNPMFLWKATQRRRLWPTMDRFRFEEFIKGFRMGPRTQKKETIQIDGDVTLSGMAITVGTVKARVCVAETIAEASQIRQGDILVTYATDIGWTAYFPLISGIVTEIGGTISHGAVIAREFGIPCLIAVQGACSRFNTGDTAYIDCQMGSVSKVKV